MVADCVCADNMNRGIFSGNGAHFVGNSNC